MRSRRLCSGWIGTTLVVLAGLVPELMAAEEADNRARFFAHAAEFEKEVVRVTDGVYVAVGFGSANSVLIEGRDGVIIVDTMGNETEAAAVKAEFDQISSKPIKAIIYTHSHGPIVSGVRVFAGDGQPDIYAHENVLMKNRPVFVHRSGRGGGNQFGIGLPKSEVPHVGIAPPIVFGPRGYIEPNKTFSGDLYAFEEAGVSIELHYAPGETDDQIFVWLPRQRVLLPGDNIYRAFPNIYPIRGAPIRRVDLWLESLARMIALQPEFLVPSHTRPVLGGEQVKAALTAYHDGLESLLEQTIAGMKRGLRPDELVENVKMPPELAENPFLQEVYGTVPWTVRAIYTYYLGWFDGNATNLFPLSHRDRAVRIVALAGGPESLLEKARAALEAGDLQWTAELTDYLLALDDAHREARELKAAALRALGENQLSANARNYYLTSAKALLEGVPLH